MNYIIHCLPFFCSFSFLVKNVIEYFAFVSRSGDDDFWEIIRPKREK